MELLGVFLLLAGGLENPVDDAGVDVGPPLPEETENWPAHGQPDGLGISIVELEEHEHRSGGKLIGVEQQEQVVASDAADAIQAVDAHVGPQVAIHEPPIAASSLGEVGQRHVDDFRVEVAQESRLESAEQWQRFAVAVSRVIGFANDVHIDGVLLGSIISAVKLL